VIELQRPDVEEEEPLNINALQFPRVPARTPFDDLHFVETAIFSPLNPVAYLIIQTRNLVLSIFARVLACDYDMAHDILDTAIIFYLSQEDIDQVPEETLRLSRLSSHYHDAVLVNEFIDEYGYLSASDAVNILMEDHLSLCASVAGRRHLLFGAMHLISAHDIRMQNRIHHASDNDINTHANAQGYTVWLRFLHQ